MRLTAIFLLTGMMHAGANGFTQTVTLSVKNMPLEKVCKEIERQTGYYFVYARDMTDNSHLVNLYVKNENIQEVLHILFAGLPYSYQVIDRVVVINTVKKEPPQKLPPPVPDPGDIKGRVVSAQGELLMNATVTTTKSKQAVTTDTRGEFKLKKLMADDEIVVSYTGYKTVRLKAGNQESLFVRLEITDVELDKVVIQAYGTTSRRLTTSNIGVVTAADIEKQPVLNPLMALQGRVAGLEVTAQTSYEQGPIKVEIRGRNVVNSNFTSDPLYIIDGVPLSVLDINGTSGSAYSSNNLSYGLDQTHMLPTGGQNPLFSLNPMDIESIEVLKDADATAIYGSRGANGVILITTKKGKAGKNSFRLNVSQGVNFITRKWDMLNTQQYLAMRREAFKNDGITPTAAIGSSGFAPDLLILDTTRHTDWQDYFWGKAGNWNQVQSDYSGGTSQTTFRLGAGYNYSKDITATSGGTRKVSFAFNLNTRSLNQKFTTALSASSSFTNSNIINVSIVSTLPPNAPDVYESVGNMNYAGYKAAGITYSFGGLLRPYSTKTNFLNAGLELKYILAKGLAIKTSFGYNNVDNNNSYTSPIASQDPKATIPPTGLFNTGNTKQNNWSVEPQAQYDAFIGQGRLSVLVGASLQSIEMKVLAAMGSGYTSDALLGSISNAPVISVSDGYGKYKYGGVFARINYNWDGKYIVNLNGRRDGSSRFGEGKRFGNFGSVGAAWMASDEAFLKNILPRVVSFVKFRGSYGITGSDAVGDYQYLTQWGNGTGLASYNGISPLTAQIQPNSNFHWQVNKKLEVAMTLGLLKDRINIEAAFYRNRCDNQLIGFPTPVFTGFSTVVANSPANVQNTGWEFTANANVIKKKNVDWSFDFNVGINKNKLVSYPNFDQSPYYYQYKIGESLNKKYLYNYLGIDPLTGQYVYEDYNHDGKITANESVPKGTGTDDRYRSINTTPDFFGGMQHSFRYKSLQLSMMFRFVKQIGTNALAGSIPGNMQNASVWQYEHRWQKPGDISEAPGLTTLATANAWNFTSSNGYWTDASYIRLSNVALSWSVPGKVLKKAKLSNLSLNVNAQNLFVITPFKGGDPEGFRFGGMPPARTITAGITCSL